MRRRDFITFAGGAAAWPLAVVAQPVKLQRIAVLMPFDRTDPQYTERIVAFVQGLQSVGLADGKNVRIEYRATGNPDELRQYAAELITLKPDVILATGVSTVVLLQQATSNVPIVFTVVPDPVGAGIVDSLAHPGGIRLGSQPLSTVSVGSGRSCSRRLRRM